MSDGSRRTVKTMCGMFCQPSMCGMLVEAEGDRLLSLRGDPENPDSHGFLCVRGQSAIEMVHSPERLTEPLLRSGDPPAGGWESTSWSSALDLIAERMAAVGRERVGVLFGHGALQSGVGSHLASRFANMYGSQRWSGSINCWTYGGLGFAMTGVLNTHTKEDLGANSEMVLLWGVDRASQPTTSRYISEARRRGAFIATIDCRVSEGARQSDLFIPIRPGTDAALALGMMHTIVGEGLYDEDFVQSHTVGFPELRDHLRDKTPEWAAEITGVPAEQIRDLARMYAARRPAMIVAGGSSMYKHASGWLSSRAISCLPALTGNLGIAGGGIGPRHGAAPSEAEDLSVSGDTPVGLRERVSDISGGTRSSGDYLAQQQSTLVESMADGRLRVLLVFGSNPLSHFPDSSRLEEGLRNLDLVVTDDLFMTETTRRVAHLALPGTTWFEELGYRASATHLYLMEKALPQLGQARPISWVLKEIAERCNVEGFFPWAGHEELIDSLIDTPAMGSPTVAKLRAVGGMTALPVSPVAYPAYQFDSPSGKVEFWSKRCSDLGLPPLPEYQEPMETPRSQPALARAYPLVLRPGRTINQFHSFYDESRAVPTLARVNGAPELWIHPDDAGARGLQDGDWMTVFNERGDFQARAKVTSDVVPGVLWMRSGWFGVNRVTNASRAISDDTADALLGAVPFAVGQSAYEALVEVAKKARLPG